MKKCENCLKSHDGKYGSGRFCSVKCSRGFSTKNKRLEINEKISIANSGKGNPPVINICKNCNSEYLATWKRRNRKYCSIECGKNAVSLNLDIRKKLSSCRINAIKNGICNGRGEKSMYFFKGDFIRCDSRIESACLDFFDRKGATSMKRCPISIEYEDDGIVRKFLPDFEIILNEKIHIIEARSYISIKSLNEKWRDYNRKSILKKKALEQFCENIGYEYFWFTKDMNLKYYNSLSGK